MLLVEQERDRERLRVALKAMLMASCRAQAMTCLNRYRATKLSEVPVQDMAKCAEELEKWLAAYRGDSILD